MTQSQTRSTFVTVVAWVFIVLSWFVSLIAILQNVMVHLMFAHDDFAEQLKNSPAADNMSAFEYFMLTSMEWVVAGFLVAALISLVSAVGLLKRRNWARRAFIVVLSLGVLANLASVVLMVAMANSAAPHNLPANFATMQLVIQVVNGAIAVAIVGLFGWLIRRLMSEKIKAEFRPDVTRHA